MSEIYDKLMTDMKAAMKETMARLKGQADGKLVSRLVGAALP